MKLGRPHALAGLLLLGMVCWGHAGWLLGKAFVAQVLLHDAWQLSQQQDTPKRPWPWADTWPVARLHAPAHGVDWIVLEGADGSAMAFGPGRVHAPSATPSRNIVLAGHRDTHFAFLERVAVGDEIHLANEHGQRQVYRVRHLGVVDHLDTSPLAPTPKDTLTLVTCYPFGESLPGPLRYIVRAERSRQRPSGVHSPPSLGHLMKAALRSVVL